MEEVPMTQDPNTDYEPDEGEGDDLNPVNAKLRRELKESKREQRAMAEELEAGRDARKRLAFSDAGIPDTGPGKFFREHYAGDLDPEVIKTAAAEYGIVDNAPVAGVSDIEAQSAAAQGASGNIAQGSDEEFIQEIERAAREAPRGQTSQRVDEVFRKYRGQVQF
jgi:hypothetical protein